VIDQQNVFGLFLNGAGDTQPVFETEYQGAQDEEIERALQQRDLFFVVSCRHPSQTTPTREECQQEDCPGT